MAQEGDSSIDIISSTVINFPHQHLTFERNYVDSARIAWKGREDEYRKNLGLLKIFNLSSNKLIGKLPNQISSLLQLVGLDVLENNLIGEILQMIGKLKN